MTALAPLLIRRQRVLLLVLLGLSVVSWLVVLRVARGDGRPGRRNGLSGRWNGGAGRNGGGRDGDGSASMTNPLVMGMTPAVFLATWTVMMAAMMLPSAAPMVLTFDAVQTARNRQGRAIVGTWVFVGGYLLVWALTGMVAYAAAVGAGWVSASSPSLASLAPRLAGTVILAAGLYQLSPLKDRCLSRCRTPTQFVLAGWRNGRLGALRMGLEHGLFCLGCCWLLFALLLPLGIMNIAAMAAVTLFVLAEKALPGGLRLVRASAAVLIVAGAAVTLFPALLPVV